VQDNADLIVYRECAEHTLARLTACLLAYVVTVGGGLR